MRCVVRVCSEVCVAIAPIATCLITIGQSWMVVSPWQHNDFTVLPLVVTQVAVWPWEHLL